MFLVLESRELESSEIIIFPRISGGPGKPTLGRSYRHMYIWLNSQTVKYVCGLVGNSLLTSGVQIPDTLVF